MRGWVWLLTTVAAACADATPVSTAVCDARAWNVEYTISYGNPVDLLLVIDDSPSMAQERRHFLEAQLPAAVDLLLGGKGADGNGLGHPDLHVGVISADLGVGPDARVDGCSLAGDDGQLRNASGCRASERNYTWYFPDRDDRAATGAALRCMADVGANGCQLSQPLEAALKALWPAPKLDYQTDPPQSPADAVLFRAGGSGHGLDTNAGFVRGRPLSTVAIIILTDQDDCSTHDPALFSLQGCVRNPQALRAVQTYVNGLRALRPGQEYLVEVAIIAGVPPAWVSPRVQLNREDLSSDYDALLALPSMQTELAGPDGTTLRPSCISATASATPPRRLVEFARDYGPYAFVRSICDYDLSALLQDMLSFGYRSDPQALCLNAPVTADSRGLLPCRMTWELPEAADPTKPLTPSRCEERPGLLSVPAAGFPQRSKRGRVLCEVRQASATRAADGTVSPEGEGYYLDPSLRALSCSVHTVTPLRFSTTVPTDIRVHLECVDETQYARVAGAPAIGERCQLLRSATERRDLSCGNPTDDQGPGKLFCHPERNRCVLACGDDAQCPASFTCGISGGLSTRVCVRPQCEP